MIVSFESKTSDVLERYLKEFEHPKNMFMEMIHNITFTEKTITRIDDIVIIEQESILSLFGKYAALPAVTLILLGMIMNYYWMMSIGGVTLILALTLLSKHFLLLMIMIKLKISGHKEKIDMVSDGFLLSKLLMEHRNGTHRSTTIPKR